jgi:hypothetical protein
MPCCICDRPDKAEESKQYSCGTCTVKVMGMNKDGRIHFVQQLEERKNFEGAEFVSKVFLGRTYVGNGEAPNGKPKLKRRKK